MRLPWKKQGPAAVGISSFLATICSGALLLWSPVAFSDTAAEAGRKLADPTSNIWALFTEIDYSWSEGDFSGGRWRSGQAVVFQPIMPFPFSENQAAKVESPAALPLGRMAVTPVRTGP